MQVIKDNQDIQDNQDNLDDQDIQDNQDNQDNLDNHDNHENHDNQDNQGNHDDQDNQAGLAHLPVNFRVIYFFLSKSYNTERWIFFANLWVFGSPKNEGGQWLMLFKRLPEQFLMFVVNQENRPPLAIFVLGKKGEERDQLLHSSVQKSNFPCGKFCTKS